MTPEQTKAVLDSLDELEAWAGGLKDKCTMTRRLIETAGTVSTVSKSQSVINPKQRAQIIAKRRSHLTKRKKNNN
jgi:hypothetical protein